MTEPSDDIETRWMGWLAVEGVRLSVRKLGDDELRTLIFWTSLSYASADSAHLKQFFSDLSDQLHSIAAERKVV